MERLGPLPKVVRRREAKPGSEPGGSPGDSPALHFVVDLGIAVGPSYPWAARPPSLVNQPRAPTEPLLTSSFQAAVTRMPKP